MIVLFCGFIKMMKNDHQIFLVQFVPDRILCRLIYHEALGFAHGILWPMSFDVQHFHALQQYSPKTENRKQQNQHFENRSPNRPSFTGNHATLTCNSSILEPSLSISFFKFLDTIRSSSSSFLVPHKRCRRLSVVA